MGDAVEMLHRWAVEIEADGTPSEPQSKPLCRPFPALILEDRMMRVVQWVVAITYGGGMGDSIVRQLEITAPEWQIAAMVFGIVIGAATVFWAFSADAHAS